MHNSIARATGHKNAQNKIRKRCFPANVCDIQHGRSFVARLWIYNQFHFHDCGQLRNFCAGCNNFGGKG